MELSFFKKPKEQTKICKKCGYTLDAAKCRETMSVCPSCDAYLRMSARERIEMIADKHSFKEMDKKLKSRNIIDFPEYDGKLDSAMKSSGENEAVVCGVAEIEKSKCCIFVMNSEFMMGSMGVIVGEKITRLFEYAAKNKLPVVGFTTSGGARMQEGIFSLMQMAKVSGAVRSHSNAGQLYITVLTDPTTGGVTASFAMEGDIIIAEPNALVGFAGARVIEQTTGEKLPEGFQRSEFLLKHGFVDMIVERQKLKYTISKILKMHEVK